jgi:hypothetical protein
VVEVPASAASGPVQRGVASDRSATRTYRFAQPPVEPQSRFACRYAARTEGPPNLSFPIQFAVTAVDAFEDEVVVSNRKCIGANGKGVDLIADFAEKTEECALNLQSCCRGRSLVIWYLPLAFRDPDG